MTMLFEIFLQFFIFLQPLDLLRVKAKVNLSQSLNAFRCHGTSFILSQEQLVLMALPLGPSRQNWIGTILRRNVAMTMFFSKLDGSFQILGPLRLLPLA